MFTLIAATLSQDNVLVSTNVSLNLSSSTTTSTATRAENLILIHSPKPTHVTSAEEEEANKLATLTPAELETILKVCCRTWNHTQKLLRKKQNGLKLKTAWAFEIKHQI